MCKEKHGEGMYRKGAEVSSGSLLRCKFVRCVDPNLLVCWVWAQILICVFAVHGVLAPPSNVSLIYIIRQSGHSSP